MYCNLLYPTETHSTSPSPTPTEPLYPFTKAHVPMWSGLLTADLGFIAPLIHDALDRRRGSITARRGRVRKPVTTARERGHNGRGV